MDLKNIIDVTTGEGSSTSFLILGKNKTALIDCGMAYCAPNLIENIKKVLHHSRKLDYILLSHSHYDHISGIPYLKKIWPDVKVMAAPYAKNILTKQSALKTIKELNNQSAEYYGFNGSIDYDDSLMKVDYALLEGDSLNLGDTSIYILETPGHTKCSLSFLVNDNIIFPSETSGCMSKSEKIYSAFIISYKQTINSIHKCQKTNSKYIVSPHFGLVSKSKALTYWEECIEIANKTRNFVLELYASGFDEDKIFQKFKKTFRNEESKSSQPDYAFEINNRAMIKSIINNK